MFVIFIETPTGTNEYYLEISTDEDSPPLMCVYGKDHHGDYLPPLTQEEVNQYFQSQLDIHTPQSQNVV
jgi:hypothetical protein